MVTTWLWVTGIWPWLHPYPGTGHLFFLPWSQKVPGPAAQLTAGQGCSGDKPDGGDLLWAVRNGVELGMMASNISQAEDQGYHL